MAPIAGIEHYARAFPVQHKHFDDDTNLESADRSRFISHWNGFTPGDIEDHARKFFHDITNQQLGPEQSISPGEMLGHVRSLKALARRLSEIPALSLDYPQAERLVRDLTSLDAAGLRSRLRALFRAGETLSCVLMWSFRNPRNTSDAFDGTRIEDLPCRLGLPTFGREEHVALAHERGGRDYVTPTAFDAGLYAEWNPGGVTRPLLACEAAYPDGLPEVVHDSIEFVEIQTGVTHIR